MLDYFLIKATLGHNKSPVSGHPSASKSMQWRTYFFNPFASGIKKVLLYPITGLFSVKIQKKFLAIKNFSANDTMSGQPNKRLIHWLFEN